VRPGKLPRRHRGSCCRDLTEQASAHRSRVPARKHPATGGIRPEWLRSGSPRAGLTSHAPNEDGCIGEFCSALGIVHLLGSPTAGPARPSERRHRDGRSGGHRPTEVIVSSVALVAECEALDAACRLRCLRR
jgi:hypothetical protein